MTTTLATPTSLAMMLVMTVCMCQTNSEQKHPLQRLVFAKTRPNHCKYYANSWKCTTRFPGGLFSCWASCLSKLVKQASLAKAGFGKCRYQDLADHLKLTVPLDEEGEKDAKRQRSEPTTPRSTSSRPPHEHDEVMGITQVEPRDAEGERFEEGIDSEFQDAEEVTTGETGEVIGTEVHGVGGFHGGLGSATLRECLDRMYQSSTGRPCCPPLLVDAEKLPDPPQVTSPSVEEDQTREFTSVQPPSPDSESQPRIKEERKEEDVTPKSETAPVGAKDEPAEPDPEDSLRPGQREELRRLIARVSSFYRLNPTTTR